MCTESKPYVKKNVEEKFGQMKFFQSWGSVCQGPKNTKALFVSLLPEDPQGRNNMICVPHGWNTIVMGHLSPEALWKRLGLQALCQQGSPVTPGLSMRLRISVVVLELMFVSPHLRQSPVEDSAPLSFCEVTSKVMQLRWTGNSGGLSTVSPASRQMNAAIDIRIHGWMDGWMKIQSIKTEYPNNTTHATPSIIIRLWSWLLCPQFCLWFLWVESHISGVDWRVSSDPRIMSLSADDTESSFDKIRFTFALFKWMIISNILERRCSFKRDIFCF